MELFRQITVIGVGLLGGSIGLASRQRELCGKVVGVRRHAPSIEEAKRLGAIDEGTTSVAEGVRDADLVVVCSPVRSIISMLPEVCSLAKPGAIITDVGSTKQSVVQAGEAATADRGCFFVGSHPMAGSEKSGVRFSSDDLYVDSTCFVAKTEATNLPAFARVCMFWHELGSRVVAVRPERHDHLVSMISHLPHLVAVALMLATDAWKEDKNLIKGIIGNGFRDTTRLAAGNVEVWDDICAENGKRITDVLEQFENTIDDIKNAVRDSDAALKQVLELANGYRQFLQNR